MSLAFQATAVQQGRLKLSPVDSADRPVTLDPDALVVTIVDGDGVFEYNAATNGLVFRIGPSGPGVTNYHVEVDGQPGPGQSFLPIDVQATFVPEGAVSAGESVSVEAAGVPA